MQKINITQFPLVTSEDFINQFYIQTRLFMVMLSDSAIVLGKKRFGKENFSIGLFPTKSEGRTSKPTEI